MKTNKATGLDKIGALLLKDSVDVITSTASNNSTKVRAARVARLFFLIQPIRSLFSGVVVAVAVVLA